MNKREKFFIGALKRKREDKEHSKDFRWIFEIPVTLMF